MSHPLSSEFSSAGLERETSPEFSQELIGSSWCLSNGFKLTTSHEVDDWSDSEELRRYKRTKKRRRKNVFLHILELVTVFSTVTTPIIMTVWDQAQFSQDNQYTVTEHAEHSHSHILAGANIVSLGVRLTVLCCFLVAMREGMCANIFHYLRRERLRSKSSIVKAEQKRTSNTIKHFNFTETDVLSFWIISITDYCALFVTLSHWISFSRHAKTAVKTKTPESAYFAPKNPFVSTESINSPGEFVKLEPIGLEWALRYVNTQLIIQMTVLFVLKVWYRGNYDCSFTVHVYRSVDGLSRNYPTSVSTIGEVAINLIHLIGLEPMQQQPLELGPKRRPFRSKSSDSGRSCRSSAGTATTLVTDAQSQPTSDSSTGKGGKRTTRRRRRKSGCKRNAFKIQFPPTSPQGTSDNNEMSIDTKLVCSSEMDQHALNRKTIERCRLQSEFDHMLRKRQARLYLITQRWFTAVGTNDLSKIEKGGKWDNGVRIEQATQLVYDRISGPLMRYLRLTDQQYLHTAASIRERLTLYLTCDMSAMSFLSLYIPSSPPTLIHHPSTRHYFLSPPKDSEEESHIDEDHTSVTQQTDSCWFAKRGASLPWTHQPTNNNQVFETWKFRVHRTSPKDHPTANKRYTLNSFIQHGLQFELTRANVTLVCSVYRVPLLELSTNTPSDQWWVTPTPHTHSVPASTIETCLTGSENFGEIRL